MSWKDRFYEAVAEYLRTNGVDCVNVTKIKEDIYYGGYCSTCSYEELRVYVYYSDSNDEIQEYNYYGNMSEFINSLD